MKKISEINPPVKFFKNPILNSLSHTSLSTVIIIFTPVALYFLFQSYKHHSVFAIILAALLGLFLWSFVEYITHRFTFHFKLNNKKLKYLHSIFHLAHHVYPHDKTKYQALLILTLPAGILYYFIFNMIFGALSEPIFAGFITGYIIYEYVHFSSHKLNLPSKISKRLKQHHMRHHYFDDSKNFGVTTSLWDHVFNTYLHPDKMRQSAKDSLG